jgi:hypothetical protein
MGEDKVYVGTDWSGPDGEYVHVAGMRWDGYEHTIMCVADDGGVMLFPKSAFLANYQPAPSRPPRP